MEIKTRKLFKDEDNDEHKTHTQYMIVVGALAIVSAFMTLVNILTDWELLGLTTLGFTIICTICVILEKSESSRKVGRVIFAHAIVALFTSFLCVGDPDGFAVFWMLLLPSCGFFLFRLKYGSIIAGAQLVIAAAIVWTPLRDVLIQYEYSDTFLMRFPIMYTAFLIVGIALEITLLDAQNKLKEAKERFEYMYNHDNLTGLYNRYGFNSTMDEFVKTHKNKGFAFGILDLDKFKQVNDTYGHLNGDIVLKHTAQIAKDYFEGSAVVCRWGGEEFSVLFDSAVEAEKKCNELLDIARHKEIELEGGTKLIKTFSMGLVIVPDDTEVQLSKLVTQADNNLYKAKEAGRNQIVCTRYELV